MKIAAERTDPPAGSLWINSGRWNWRVTLPGSVKRQNLPLCIDGATVALPESKGRDLAANIAWRLWETLGEKKAPDTGATQSIDTLAAAYLVECQTYYRRKDGTPTGEAYNCEVALRSIRARPLGVHPISDTRFEDIKAARENLIKVGLNRKTINQRLGVWKRFFKWAHKNRHCSIHVREEACALENLPQDRSLAPEGEPVTAVAHKHVKPLMPFMPPTLQAMVTVHELCGARPAEMCLMRADRIKKGVDLWTYRPERHKTQHKGQVRVIVLGPRAQKALAPLMDRDGYLFSPRIVASERKAEMRRNRKTKVQPSQVNRASEAPQKEPGDVYDCHSYFRAVRYAIKKAQAAGVKVDEWHPNQLRHACGSRVRHFFGGDAARCVLGHAEVGGASRVTDIYTGQEKEREVIRIASRSMKAIG